MRIFEDVGVVVEIEEFEVERGSVNENTDGGQSESYQPPASIDGMNF